MLAKLQLRASPLRFFLFFCATVSLCPSPRCLVFACCCVAYVSSLSRNVDFEASKLQTLPSRADGGGVVVQQKLSSLGMGRAFDWPAIRRRKGHQHTPPCGFASLCSIVSSIANREKLYMMMARAIFTGSLFYIVLSSRGGCCCVIYARNVPSLPRFILLLFFAFFRVSFSPNGACLSRFISLGLACVVRTADVFLQS